MVLFLLTLLVVAIPTLHVLNSRYVQRIALFIGASQVALLAMAGKIDHQLSGFAVNSFNKIISFSYNVVIHKICCLLFSII